MKIALRIISIVLCLSFLVACTKTETPVVTEPLDETDKTEVEAPETDAPEEKPTEAPLSAAEQWAKDNGLGIYQPPTEDWAAIEAAAKAEGSVIVYSNSSRILDAADIWATLYPDIKIEAFDLGGAEVVAKVREEQKAGAFTGDVWFNAQGPDMEGEFIPNHYIWKFLPAEAAAVMPPENQDPVATQSTEIFGFIYNSELNDKCPISNIWEITDPVWKGKFFMKDPINSAEDLGMLMSIARHVDELAAAYEALYGKAWNTDAAFSTDTPDAGWLWMKKLAQIQPIGVGGSDDVWGAMAVPGLTENMLGWAPLSKYRKVIKGDAVFEPCVGLTPVIGAQKHNYVAVINQAPHPNAAKLFIKFALSAEGFTPWNQVGQYSGRTDIAPVEEALVFKSLPVYNFDNMYIYQNISAYRDFYATYLLAP